MRAWLGMLRLVGMPRPAHLVYQKDSSNSAPRDVHENDTSDVDRSENSSSSAGSSSKSSNGKKRRARSDIQTSSGEKKSKMADDSRMDTSIFAELSDTSYSYAASSRNTRQNTKRDRAGPSIRNATSTSIIQTTTQSDDGKKSWIKGMSSADQQQLLSCLLQQAASSLPTERLPAEEQLRQGESAPGFYLTLLRIYADPAISDSKLKWLAIIYIKNGLDKYWRKRTRAARSITISDPVTAAIGEEEKVAFRHLLVSPVCFASPIKQLNSQHAMVLAKIARLDFPREWPSVVDDCFNVFNAQSHDLALCQNVLYGMRHIIKALCSKTLPLDKAALYQMAPKSLPAFIAIFNSNMATFYQLFHAHQQQGTDSLPELNPASLILARNALKSIRSLLNFGFVDFTQDANAFQFFPHLLKHLKQLHSILSLYPHWTLVSKSANLIGKLYLGLETDRIFPFLTATGAIQVLQYSWARIEAYSRQADVDGSGEKGTLQCLLILKGVIKNNEFSVVSKEVHETRDACLAMLKKDLFSDSFLQHALNVLVTKYLVLTDDELELWESDAETFISEEEADQWEYNLHGCAEKVIMDLVSKNRALLSPVIVSMLGSVNSIGPHHATSEIRLKDAVYCLAGICAYDLYDFIDFESWFMASLLPEVQIHDYSYLIMTRRIAVLIGKWIPVKCSHGARPSVYATLVSLLGHSDAVVRLTAISSLHISIDDYEFELEQFEPYLEGSTAAICKIISISDSLDSKVKAIKCLCVIIDRTMGKFAPAAQNVLNLVPNLWASSEGQFMFRSSLVVLLTAVIAALKGGDHLQPLIVPVIQYAVDISLPSHVYLMDDGLELWSVTLSFSSSLSPALLDLVPFTLALLDFGTENLRKVLAILQSYILLNAKQVLSLYAQPIMSLMASILEDLRPNACSAVLRTLDLIIQVCNRDGLLSALQTVLLSTQVMRKLVHTILTGSELGVILVGYTEIVCRLMLYDGNWVSSCLAEDTARLIECICDKYDMMALGKQRKLTAMALSSLLCIPSGNVALQKLAIILPVLSAVAYELQGLDTDGIAMYTYQAQDPDDITQFTDDEGSPHRERKAALNDLDPVLKEEYMTFIRRHLAIAQQVHAGTFSSAISTVDAKSLEQMAIFNQ